MIDKKKKPQEKARADEGLKTSAGKGLNDKLEKEKNKTDTAPDEFISPNADTDQPIEGQVLNDAVLRGESHDDNLPPPGKQP